MRKLALIPFILLIALLIPLASALSTPINTVCVLYGVSNPDVDEVAVFDAFVCDFHYNYNVAFDIASDINSIKAFHNDILTYGYMSPCMISTNRAYYAEVDSHEDWFVHRTDNGSRIYEPSWQQYLLNVTNSDYRTFFVNWVNGKINDGNLTAPFTGVLFDYFNVDLNTIIGQTLKDVTPADYASNFYAYMIDFMQEVKPLIDGEVVINSDECLGDLHMYLDEVDGEMCERIGHPAFGADYNDAATNLHILEQMEYAAANSKRFFAVGGDDEYTDGSDVNQFCYCTFLMSAYSDSYFGIGAPGAIYNAIYTDLTFDYNLGTNTTDRTAEGTGWNRTFTAGHAHVNFNNLTSEVTLDSPTSTPTAAPYVPPFSSLGSGSGFDSLIGLCAVLAVFAIIIWPFLPEDRKHF